MDSVLLIARLLLAGVLGVAGFAKLADRPGARQALIDFGVPPWLASPLGVLLPLAEYTVAVALVPTTTAWRGPPTHSPREGAEMEIWCDGLASAPHHRDRGGHRGGGACGPGGTSMVCADGVD